MDIVIVIIVMSMIEIPVVSNVYRSLSEMRLKNDMGHSVWYLEQSPELCPWD